MCKTDATQIPRARSSAQLSDKYWPSLPNLKLEVSMITRESSLILSYPKKEIHMLLKCFDEKKKHDSHNFPNPKSTVMQKKKKLT